MTDGTNSPTPTRRWASLLLGEPYHPWHPYHPYHPRSSLQSPSHQTLETRPGGCRLSAIVQYRQDGPYEVRKRASGRLVLDPYSPTYCNVTLPAAHGQVYSGHCATVVSWKILRLGVSSEQESI
jgi:hypothetical protein